MSIDWSKRKHSLLVSAEEAKKDPSLKNKFLLDLLSTYHLDANAIKNDEYLSNEDKKYYNDLLYTIDCMKDSIKNNKDCCSEGTLYLGSDMSEYLKNKMSFEKLVESICSYYHSDISVIIDNLKQEPVEDVKDPASPEYDYSQSNELQYYQELQKTLDKIQKLFNTKKIK